MPQIFHHSVHPFLIIIRINGHDSIYRTIYLNFLLAEISTTGRKEEEEKKEGTSGKKRSRRTDPPFSSAHSINRRRGDVVSHDSTIVPQPPPPLMHRSPRKPNGYRDPSSLSNGRISPSSPSWVQFVRITSWITPQNRVVCCAPIIDAPQPT